MGERATNRSSRDRWLARQPAQAVAHAARTQQWQGAIHWALGEALQSVNDAAAVADAVGLTMFDGGPSMREWLTTMVMRPDIPWDLAASRMVGSAYDRTLVVQRGCSRADKQAIARIARCMRDVIVMVAISDAGGHRDQETFKHALSAIFGRPLDSGVLGQMEHSYHQLTHGVPGAFVSGCKRGRLRRARVRQRDDEASSGDDAEGEEYDSTQQESDGAESAQHAGGAMDALQSMPDRAAAELAELRRMMRVESDRLWKALESEQAKRQQLERETFTMREELEHYDAEVARLTAKRHSGEVRHGNSLTQRLYPALVEAEDWLKQHCEPFADPHELVEIPVLCFRWRQNNIDSAMAFRRGEPDSVHELVQQLHSGTRKPNDTDEPLDVVELNGEFWSLDNRKLAALVMYQSLHRDTLVKASCRICSGSSSSGASGSTDPVQGRGMDSGLLEAADLVGGEVAGRRLPQHSGHEGSKSASSAAASVFNPTLADYGALRGRHEPQGLRRAEQRRGLPDDSRRVGSGALRDGGPPQQGF